MKTNEGGRELLNQRCNNLSFKEEKAIAALSQLCQLANNRLDHYKAAKLMYLFDRDVLLNTGEPAFYGAYYALRLGPIISEVNNGIKSCNRDDVEVPFDWKGYFTLNEKDHVIIQHDPDTHLFEGLLSEEEVDRLKMLFDRYKTDRENKQLKSDIAALPEHITLSPDEKRRSMSYAYILAKNGFTSEQIDELLNEIAYDDYFRFYVELPL